MELDGLHFQPFVTLSRFSRDSGPQWPSGFRLQTLERDSRGLEQAFDQIRMSGSAGLQLARFGRDFDVLMVISGSTG
jgi:hypothetical protein